MQSEAARLILVTPQGIDSARALRALVAAVEANDVAALLIADGPEQKALAAALTGPAQERNVAVLIEGDVAEAKAADGVMIEADLALYRAARERLGVDAIVGVAADSRHAAMELADAGADFIAFQRLDLIAWWNEIATVPCVALVPGVAASFMRADDRIWEAGDAP